MGSTLPRQVVLHCIRAPAKQEPTSEWARKQNSSRITASSSCLRLSISQWQTVPWKCKPHKFIPFPSCFQSECFITAIKTLTKTSFKLSQTYCAGDKGPRVTANALGNHWGWHLLVYKLYCNEAFGRGGVAARWLSEWWFSPPSLMTWAGAPEPTLCKEICILGVVPHVCCGDQNNKMFSKKN